jgi:SAM-dependent methyltransferase
MLALPDSYDEVRYPGFPRKQSHPSFIAALAAIAGMEIPAVEQWRVLEIGCGNGSNILPLAYDYPEASFIGIDRASSAIESGRTLASRLQLNNIELQNADLMIWEPEGQFDYIIAHGVFSWVGKEIREKILKICGACLKPRGLAFISYNALPGCHFRRYVGDFLKFHVRRLKDPAARTEKARNLARMIVDRASSDTSLHSIICSEMETILEKDESVLYHDDLAETNEPFYLTDFVDMAASYGLRYLGDAEAQRDDVRDMPLQAEDWIESRQYGDFMVMRRFRESLLCRQEIALDRKLELSRFLNLYVASRVQPAEVEANGQQRFALPKSGNLTTNHPLAKEVLCRLAAIWPQSMRVSELPIELYAPDTIPDLLMRLHQARALELRIHPPKIAQFVSDQPTASALVRAQVAEGYRMVTNQWHSSIELEDEIIRTVLSLLDGSRNRQAFAQDLLAAGLAAEMIESTIDQSLAGLNRLSLLIA